MKANIIYYEWTNNYPESYDGEGTYLLVTEDCKVINDHFCTSRWFAEVDLTTNFNSEQILIENNITEVYSNGALIYTRL